MFLFFLIHFSRITSISKYLVPNLWRLKIAWFNTIMNVDSINELFQVDVLFSLTKFTLSGEVDGPNVLQHIRSKLSSQCLYSFVVEWHVKNVVSLSESDNIFFNIFHQLKGSVPIQLKMYLLMGKYYIRASTIPMVDTDLYVSFYLDKKTVHG
jgi:hypothetical protein